MKLRNQSQGFTILEIIAVLVIIAIIAVVALARVSSNENNLIGAADTLKSHLRLAQARSMNSSTDTGIVWGINITSATQYYLFYCTNAAACDPNNAAHQVPFPGAGNVVMDLTSQGVKIVNGVGLLAFNRFGTPYINAALTTLMAKPLSITLQDNQNRTITITVTPQTGMII